ncbi:MAG: radical SAM protein [Lachnospiraceae bacterium]|nr:radical SAM protein [Lachnospiraceae bacterium]MDE7203127.1 radical SAM protein [Lachnospiraceae bacterium]
MAKISNMLNPNRINLGESIPLDTPLVIQLETSGFCNLECKFCPCGDKDARKLFRQDIMTEDLFDIFIEQCKAFPNKIKILRIIGVGEPLVNNNIASFVSKAKACGTFEKVEITTNGVLLDEKLSDALVEAGLDVLLVSLEATNNERFYEITGKHVDVLELKKKLEYFFKHSKNTKLYIKTTDLSIVDMPGGDEAFLEEYGEICDYIYVEKVIENWPEFHAGAVSGSVRYSEDVYKQRKQICVQPFKLLCVSANGDVMPCSVDWKRALLLGNITKTSLLDIWNGRKLNSLRCTLLKMEPCNFCSECKYTVQNQPDNIDEYKEMILRRLGDCEVI